MEQASSRGHEAGPQSGLGMGCERCSSSIKLRGLSARAQARRISTSLPFPVAGVFLVPVSPAQRDEERRVEVQYMASVRGALCLSSSLFKPLQRRYTVQLQTATKTQGTLERCTDARPHCGVDAWIYIL